MSSSGKTSRHSLRASAVAAGRRVARGWGKPSDTNCSPQKDSRPMNSQFRETPGTLALPNRSSVRLSLASDRNPSPGPESVDLNIPLVDCFDYLDAFYEETSNIPFPPKAMNSPPSPQSFCSSTASSCSQSSGNSFNSKPEGAHLSHDTIQRTEATSMSRNIRKETRHSTPSYF